MNLQSRIIELNPQWRGVGKSILLKQLINNLILQEKVQPTRILFFEFSPNQDRELIGNIYRYFKQNILQNGESLYLFFDEVQVVPGFEIAIKEIYDNLDQTREKMVITGSPSISYKRKMAESLAGRFIAYRLFPLNFKEYLRLSISPLLPKVNNPSHDNLSRMGDLEQLNMEFKRFR